MSQFIKPPVCPSCNADASEDFIIMHSGCNRDRGFVHLAWAGQRAQFTPDQAREHALRLLEAAEAAESDHCVLKMLTQDVRMDIEQSLQFISVLRKYRDGTKT